MTTTLTHKGVPIKIIQDENAESPAENGDQDLFLMADHRQLFIPPNEDNRRFDIASEIELRSETHWSFLVEAYIHSGIVLALVGTRQFPDRQRDVSKVGAVLAAKSEWSDEAKAREAAECLIGEWNKYLSGDVWGYVAGEGTAFEDSCWGFYGQDYCIKEAKGAADYIAEQMQVEAREAQRCACADVVTV